MRDSKAEDDVEADAVESRHCWQPGPKSSKAHFESLSELRKEAKEAEQRRKEMPFGCYGPQMPFLRLVRAFPANSRHVTVMIEVSVHMVQLELAPQRQSHRRDFHRFSSFLLDFAALHISTSGFFRREDQL